MPKAFPAEFRDNVVPVARRREQPIRQIAKDFGVSESCLNRWLAIDEIKSGDRPGPLVEAVESGARDRLAPPGNSAHIHVSRTGASDRVRPNSRVTQYGG